jgi:flagellar basal-body rod modification protein FlgD
MITSVAKTDASLAQSQITGGKDIGKQDFLKLFIKQLQSQDPLSPMDSADFTAQLAQFSSLEQLTNSNDKLGQLISMQNSQTGLMASSIIGKTVMANGDSVYMNGKNGVDLAYSIGRDVDKVNVNVYDTDGKLVRSLSGNAVSAGSRSIRWDGTDNNGNSLPAGTYDFTVSGTDSGGVTVDAATFTTGTVERVSFANGIPMVTVNGSTLPMSSVVNIEDMKQQGGY